VLNGKVLFAIFAIGHNVPKKRTIQRNWQHRVYNSKKNKTKTQRIMCWTPLRGGFRGGVPPPPPPPPPNHNLKKQKLKIKKKKI
jgi:hypothetical protein